MELVIDTDIEAALPPLSQEEFAQLEQNILSVGRIIDPIVVWGVYIIDGINRYRIATKHGLTYDTVSMEFPSKDAVIKWMHRNQIGRRNLAGIGLIQARASIAKALEEDEGQSLIAEALHISPRTLRSNKQIDSIIQTLPQEISAKLKSGELKTSAKNLRELGGIPIESREAIYADWLESSDLKLALACNRSGIDTETLDQILSKMEPVVANRIKSGATTVTKQDIDCFNAMPKEKQEIVSLVMLDTTSLAEAVRIVETSKGVTTKDKIVAAKDATLKSLAILRKKLEDLSALSAQSCDEVCSMITQAVNGYVVSC